MFHVANLENPVVTELRSELTDLFSKVETQKAQFSELHKYQMKLHIRAKLFNNMATQEGECLADRLENNMAKLDGKDFCEK